MRAFRGLFFSDRDYFCRPLYVRKKPEYLLHLVHNVIELLKNPKRGDIQKISAHTHFKIRTLYNWANALKQDPNFDPLKTKCGQHHRIFTDKEEDAITDFIIENIIKAGILFTDEDFEDLIMTAYLEKYKDVEDIPKFNASKGFIYDFKKHHGITSRRCHTKRRPDNKRYDQMFIDAMTDLFNNVNLKYIVNIDETAWETVPTGLRAWHLVGEDHVVRYVNANDKEKITVVAAIAADGTKLPLQFIAKGNSPQVIDTQIGDVAYHLKTYSSNGWTTSETFKEFLLSVRTFYGFDDKNTIHILLDVFRAHLTDDVKELADQLNIKMYLNPGGFTNSLQPLDKKELWTIENFCSKNVSHEIYQRSKSQTYKTRSLPRHGVCIGKTYTGINPIIISAFTRG